jgi:Transposase DDE domain
MDDRPAKIQERDLAGFKYFKRLLPLLDRLHAHNTARDRAHHRTLHYDQHIALILLYLFNPIVSSLRSVVQASELKKVQRTLGCARASLGSLSEAHRVFDSSLLLGIIAELSADLKPMKHDARLDEVGGILTLVDGTLLTALPRLVEAMWLDADHPALKLHTHFELLTGVPASIDITDANASEWKNLAARLLADRVYVMDRGYACFELFGLILQIGSSFVCRVRDNSVYELIEQRTITPEAAGAGIVSDRIVHLGHDTADHRVTRPLRLIEVSVTPHRKRIHGARGGPEQSQLVLICTDLLDLPAEVIALIYQQRWAIEIFFRFFKHVLGCRHLLAHNNNGIEIQTYCAIIACLLIALWTGKKPTLRTYEMVCYYFMGLADEEELDHHIARLGEAEKIIA